MEIPLQLSEKLKNEVIIQKFVIDKKDNYIKLRLNSKYDPSISIDVSIDVIKEKNGWTKFTNKFRKDMKDFGVDNDHNLQIYSSLNENGSLIRENVLSDLSDLSAKTKNGSE